jgi:ParB/RepB/Spo0J family partition protein
MEKEVEISSLDCRYEDFRIKNRRSEAQLLASISQHGIMEALEGTGDQGKRILLNGFKRYRCALKLGITQVPYICLDADEAIGIIELLRISNTKTLTILEQALLIDELKKVFKLNTSEIATQLDRSKSWVSVRIGLCNELSDSIRQKIFDDQFPAYSYMYTLRQFIRINGVSKKEIEQFVEAVSGKKLSVRDIERLAYSYFKGPDEFKEQINNNNLSWVFERLKEVPKDLDGCNQRERRMLNDLEILQKYMQKVMRETHDKHYTSPAFFAQANLLSGGILSKQPILTRTLREFYDRTGQA